MEGDAVPAHLHQFQPQQEIVYRCRRCGMTLAEFQAAPGEPVTAPTEAGGPPVA